MNAPYCPEVAMGRAAHVLELPPWERRGNPEDPSWVLDLGDERWRIDPTGAGNAPFLLSVQASDENGRWGVALVDEGELPALRALAVASVGGGAVLVDVGRAQLEAWRKGIVADGEGDEEGASS